MKEHSTPKSQVARISGSDRSREGSPLWWAVWIPIIVVVTLWIGGWWFGNYGGPWNSQPQHLKNPKISDPAILIGTFR